MPRPRREPTHDRLVRAARERFAAEGFAGASLDAVAADAGVTKGSLYHHFSGKADLFEAVFAAEARSLSARVAADVAAQRDPWKGALAGIRAFLRLSQEPAVQRIMLLDAPSALGWERVRAIEAGHGLALIEAAVAEVLPGRPAGVLAHLLFGALTEGALLVAQGEASARTVEREVVAMLEGMRAG